MSPGRRDAVWASWRILSRLMISWVMAEVAGRVAKKVGVKGAVGAGRELGDPAHGVAVKPERYALDHHSGDGLG